eukprot:1329450-Amphidinium_carterae.2
MTGHTPDFGHEYKTAKLKEMRARRKEIARLWMCKPTSVQSALKEWVPPSAWSDIRVHLSLAYMANTVVVINDTEQGSCASFVRMGLGSRNPRF